MKTLALRGLAADLGLLRDRIGGEEADRLDILIDRLRALADDLDKQLARLGNPPTDKL
jgi:hypothetical protein